MSGKLPGTTQHWETVSQRKIGAIAFDLVVSVSVAIFYDVQLLAFVSTVCVAFFQRLA